VQPNGPDITPLSNLAVPPSINRTWPVVLSKSLFGRIVAVLPPHVAASLPPYLRPAVVEAESEQSGSELDTPTPAARRGKKSRSETPKDSPATTELESEGEEESGEVPSGPGNGVVAEKKKRRVGGKAIGARRRKMGAK
jgi:hypothetical protein